jgi:PHD/YefM family antitoxin component YafN of YafNO toxin-antitoxin module
LREIEKRIEDEVMARQSTEIIAKLRRDREPNLIIQHGAPSAYLVDVEAYETLLRRMSLLEGIARGEKSIEEGRTVSHAQAKQRMARWLK